MSKGNQTANYHSHLCPGPDDQWHIGVSLTAAALVAAVAHFKSGPRPETRVSGVQRLAVSFSLCSVLGGDLCGELVELETVLNTLSAEGVGTGHWKFPTGKTPEGRTLGPRSCL